MRRVIQVLLILVTILFSGCANDKRAVIIDWVDFIQFNDITYEGIYSSATFLDASYLDKEYARVAHKVADNVFDPHYKTQNGDAAFLEKDTSIYEIKGYSPDFRLATYRGGKIVIYEADRNPNAKKGKDLLDIKNKVKHISINSESDGKKELSRIEDRDLVDKLVNMVLEAQLIESIPRNGQRYFICFQLNDGTNVSKVYWIDSDVMSHNIQLPEEFGEEISKSLNK